MAIDFMPALSFLNKLLEFRNGTDAVNVIWLLLTMEMISWLKNAESMRDSRMVPASWDC